MRAAHRVLFLRAKDLTAGTKRCRSGTPRATVAACPRDVAGAEIRSASIPAGSGEIPGENRNKKPRERD